MSVWVLLGFAILKVFLLNNQDRRQCRGTQLNVEMAHTEIWSTSNPSPPIVAHDQDIPRFIIFFIFVVFLAWEGTTLSIRRGGNENGAKGFEGGRRKEQVWTYGRMCKNTKWTMPQGTLAPGGGFGGGFWCSVVGWWWFCQSNLDVNSVTVDFFSLTLEGDDGVMLMKVELRFNVYLKKRGGCFDSLFL